MKLIVQIPCYNEEETLPQTVRDVPRRVPGIDEVEILVVDDGSSDRTAEVARECGVDHVVSLVGNQGLAKAFRAGVEACLALRADVIVNTDGDNQYYGGDIATLVGPIVRGEAEMVIGTRSIDTIEHFSFLKKKLQHLGSWVVRTVSGTDVPDATSGFRAFSREAALRLNVVSRFTYTLETLIQAGVSGTSVAHVPIRTNPKLRESRLARSAWRYVLRSLATIVRIYAMYRSMRLFTFIAGVLVVLGVAVGARFVVYLFIGEGEGHVQSLILAAVLVMVGVQTFVAGLLSDLITSNRRLTEECLYHLRKHSADTAHPPAGAGAPRDTGATRNSKSSESLAPPDKE